MYSVLATSPMSAAPRPPQPTTATSILLLRSRPRTYAGAPARKVAAAPVWRNVRRVMGVVMGKTPGGGKSTIPETSAEPKTVLASRAASAAGLRHHPAADAAR